MENLRLILLTAIFTLMIPSGSVVNAQAHKTVTYNIPLAYIGWDGNIWITDLKSGAGTRITTDGLPLTISPQDGVDTPNGANVRFYTGLHWSPNGDKLSAGENSGTLLDNPTYTLYVVASGKSPLRLQGNPPGLWHPDEASLAFSPVTLGCPDSSEEAPIQETSLVTQQVQMITTIECTVKGIGDGPGWTDARFLLALEQGQQDQEFTAPIYLLSATTYGYLYTADDGLVQMIGFDGRLLWTATFSQLGLSPDGKFAYATVNNTTSKTNIPVIVDLATGNQSPLPIAAPDGDVFRLSDDHKSLFYSTIEQNESRPDYSEVRLWKLSLDTGKAVNLFARSGTGIGVITPTPDGKGIVFSLVTSTALFGAKDHPQIAEGRAHVELLYLDLVSLKVRFLALGGQPTFGTKPFTVVDDSQ